MNLNKNIFIVLSASFFAEFCFDTPTPTPDTRNESLTVCQSVYLKACNVLGITPSTYLTHHMTEVDLSIPYHGIGVKGAKAVAIAMVQNTSVQRLNLANNDIKPEGLSYILEMLQVNRNITELRNRKLRTLLVKHSCFREKGGISIGEALEQNSVLTELDLSWNHLRQTGAVAICSGLINNYSLKTLNLSWNGFGMEGCHEMGKSLMQNRTLTDLDLSANRVSFDAFRQLLRGVIRNKSLKTLKIGMNPITTDGAFAILRSIAVSNSALNYIDLTDVSVDSDFLNLLEEMQKTREITIKHGNTLRHDEIRKGDVVRVLDTDDPIAVLFEYMKAKNLRLIDLLHNLDRDHSDTVSREEFQQGLSNIDLPLSSRSLDILMSKLDINKDGHVDYEELSIRHKEYIRKITRLRVQADEGPSHYKGYDKLQQLREAVRLKISLNIAKGT
ncbi:hypothetical protein FSP39_013199 [Pinctada imbricata]|uniref:EF-hand domain-containing protein n=1 Tax=Pinctada imbricata TaxID=66713 RepID=A0AA89BXC3_PINIB|nr:hypothetical protein FSP39_013199 [Pinctada imbricata]